VNESWNRTALIKQCMQLDGGFGAAELCPVEEAQAEINGRRVESVDGSFKFGKYAILGLKCAGTSNQAQGKCLDKCANRVC
jgi:hypothetical protein